MIPSQSGHVSQSRDTFGILRDRRAFSLDIRTNGDVWFGWQFGWFLKALAIQHRIFIALAENRAEIPQHLP
jgi:hypothetical protein